MPQQLVAVRIGKDKLQVRFDSDLLFAVDGNELNLQGGRDYCWGVGAAVDIRPGASNWAIHAGVRRYESNPEFTNRDNGAVGSAAFNPVVVTVGVGYRF